MEGFWQDKMGSNLPGNPRTGHQVELGREEQYWKSRRSLRIWPMDSGTSACLETFLLSKLGMSTAQVASIGTVDIVPSGAKGPPPIRDEYICTFDTKDTRDMVRANASNIALLPASSPAGIRLEIPDFLQNNFKVLQNAAYQIKQNNRGAKRNVLFDDDKMDLALDIKLSDAVGWQRISPAEARTAGARAGKGPSARKNLDASEISSMMGSAGGSGGASV